MEGLLQDLRGMLRLAAITLKALLGFEVATLSGFRMFFDISCGGGHTALLFVCGSVAVAVCPRACDTSPLASVGTVSPLSVLAAFFCEPCAVYMHPHGLANSHTVFCTPRRHREG